MIEINLKSYCDLNRLFLLIKNQLLLCAKIQSSHNHRHTQPLLFCMLQTTENF